ncbi:MAG TPA: MarR family transcriptional regulator [Candidatus Sulfotelmatobacter sp.]|nr:MarR family transcriptional regulator [Candidatus Sulfotelmatobacter sp.]
MRQAALSGTFDFGFRVSRIARRLRQAIDGELGAFGLTEATWRPLAYVGRLGDGVRQKELATALGIEGPSLVRLLDNLEGRGLIERREDGSDRRVRGIHLTASGRALAARVSSVSAGIQRRLLLGLAPDDIAAFQRILQTIERALDAPVEIAKPTTMRRRKR